MGRERQSWEHLLHQGHELLHKCDIVVPHEGLLVHETIREDLEEVCVLKQSLGGLGILPRRVFLQESWREEESLILEEDDLEQIEQDDLLGGIFVVD